MNRPDIDAFEMYSRLAVSKWGSQCRAHLSEGEFLDLIAYIRHLEAQAAEPPSPAEPFSFHGNWTLGRWTSIEHAEGCECDIADAYSVETVDDRCTEGPKRLMLTLYQGEYAVWQVDLDSVKAIVDGWYAESEDPVPITVDLEGDAQTAIPEGHVKLDGQLYRVVHAHCRRLGAYLDPDGLGPSEPDLTWIADGWDPEGAVPLYRLYPVDPKENP